MVQLQNPSSDLLASYLEFIEEMRSAGEKVWESMYPGPHESPQDFLHRLCHEQKICGPNLVPESVFWAVLNSQVVGRIALRHTLNENLKEFGGHVGYEVRPSARRKGFATEMLRLLLQTPEARAMGEVLVTCAPDNIASNKTITTNGGVLKRTAFVERVQRNTNYYSILIPR